MMHNMNYITDEISLDEFLIYFKRQKREVTRDNYTEHADSSLIANTPNYANYPCYFEYESVNGKNYVIETQFGVFAHIYTIDPNISDYEYPCHEIFLEQLPTFRNPTEMHQLYFLNVM